MKLTLSERINTLGILPEEANFITLKIVRDLQMRLALSEEEKKKYNVKMEQTAEGLNYTWDPETGGKALDEIEMGEVAIEIITKRLKELDKQEKLNEGLFTLYEKFVLNNKENV